MSSRIWLIGNGASLKETPKHLLENEITMGVNKGHQWLMPDYYVKVDLSIFNGENTWKDEIIPMVNAGIPCLLWDRFRESVKNPRDGFYQWIPEGIGDYENVTWVKHCDHRNYPPGHKSSAKQWHEPFCTAYNSISIMAQWAVKLGFEEIYLVGCDLIFTDGVTDHFMPYYSRVDSEYIERNQMMALAAHQFIKDNCPIPVYNATIGGFLEVHERVDIREVLCDR